MNVFSFVQWNIFIPWKMKCTSLVEWNILSFTSWKYLYHCNHKLSSFVYHSFNTYSMWCVMLVPHTLLCDWSQLHPSNQRCCQVVWLCMITKICEWIYSANPLAPAHHALKERWLLLYTPESSLILHEIMNTCWSTMQLPLKKCFAHLI